MEKTQLQKIEEIKKQVGFILIQEKKEEIKSTIDVQIKVDTKKKIATKFIIV